MPDPPVGQPPPGGGPPGNSESASCTPKEKRGIITYRESDSGPFQVMIESFRAKKTVFSQSDADNTVEKTSTASVNTDNIGTKNHIVAQNTESLHIGKFSHLSIAKTILNMHLDDLINFEKKGRNRLCVVFRTPAAANKLLLDNSLREKGYTMFIPLNIISCKGIVKFVDIDMSVEEIMKESSAYNIDIIDVKRLNRRKTLENGEVEYVPTSTVRFTFQGKTLPKFIDIYRLPMPVEPYMLPIIQCYNCFLYGHVQKNCNGRRKCKTCGIPSDSNRHIQDCKTRCIHCSSDAHTSTSKLCPEYNRQKMIRELMSLNNLSLYDANSRVPKTTTSPSTTYVLRESNFPGLPSNSNAHRVISVDQRRNYLSQPIMSTYSNVVNLNKRKRPESPRTPPPREPVAPGFDVEAHNSCLMNPNGRLPMIPRKSVVSSGSFEGETEHMIIDSNRLPIENSQSAEFQVGQIDTILAIFNSLTETEKETVFYKIADSVPNSNLSLQDIQPQSPNSSSSYY